MLAMWVDIATAAPQAIERPAILGLRSRIEIGQGEPQAHGLAHPAIRTGLLNDQKGLSDQIVAGKGWSTHEVTRTQREQTCKGHQTN